MKTILDALELHADQRGRDTFCHFLQAGREIPICYEELRGQARRYAALFQHQGVRPGEVVLIILRHSPDLLFSFLGAMLAGAIPSFMPFPTSKQDPRLYWDSHQKLFDRIGAGAVLTYPENSELLQRNIANLPLRLFQPEDARGSWVPLEAGAAAPHQVAFLQHSSGTTGLKKGVALTHRAVLRQVSHYAETLAMSSSDRIVSWLPLYHDMGLIACFMTPLITGTPVVLMDPFEWVADPGMLFAAVQQYQGTLCWLPNFAFHHLCRTVRRSPGLDLTSMRAWINCSEPCRAETFRGFAQAFGYAGVRAEQLQVCYAMAETVFAVTQTPLGRSPRVLIVDAQWLREKGQVRLMSSEQPGQEVLSTGKPVPGLQVRIVDDQGLALPEDCVGEITISGDCLFSGYYRLEKETGLKLKGEWYHSGDLGFLHEGELFFTGRKNDLIIVHGRNYYAHELEFVVNQVPGVHPGRNVAAGWFRPEIGTEEVVIVAEVQSGEQTNRRRLVQDIKQAMLDRAGLLVYDVHLVDPGWLVKTTSGKISRVENLNKYLAALPGGRAEVLVGQS